MKSFIAFIRLLRPVNLIIVAFTAIAIRYAILIPLIQTSPIDMKPTQSHSDFALLVLMLVLLTAAGNIINDYFDLRVDRINKPQRIVIDKYVKRRVAMAAHIAFNVIAVLIGIYLSWTVKIWLLAILPLFIAGSLWQYSVVFKKQFLIGNVVVALMASLLPLMVGLYEIPLLFEEYYLLLAEYCSRVNSETQPEAFFAMLWTWILAYSAYAFIVTLVREIQKDLEDIEGDMLGQYKTMPIVWGKKWTSRVASLLIITVIISLLLLQNYLLQGQPIYIWMIFNICLTLPLLLSLVFTTLGRRKRQYAKASLFTKGAMMGMLIVTVMFMSLIQSV